MNYRQQIEDIKGKLLVGVYNYDQAKELAMPIINEMNEKAVIIAKKFNKKHKKFSFAALIR